MPGSEAFVTHILYSDGLANVSVFIATGSDSNTEGRASVGASNSYSAVVDGNHVTAIGEVPSITVTRIASSMRARQDH